MPGKDVAGVFYPRAPLQQRLKKIPQLAQDAKDRRSQDNQRKGKPIKAPKKKTANCP